MSRRSLIFAFSIMGLLLVLAAFFVTLTPAYKDCAQQHYYEIAAQKPYEQSVGGLVPLICVGDVFNTYGNSVTAGATLAIALFTVVLAMVSLASVKQAELAANAASKSAKVAEDTLKVTNRPWIDVSHWKIDIFEPDFRPLHVSFKIENFGKSPAWITEVEAKFTTIDSGTDFPPIPDYNSWALKLLKSFKGRVVRPDKPIDGGCPFERAMGISTDEYNAIRKSFKYLWCFGLIVYEDFLGDEHETAFSAQYQSVTDEGGKEAGYWIANSGPDAYHYHDRKRSKDHGVS